MIFLFGYLGIGLIIGLFFYVAALRVLRTHPGDEALIKMVDLIERAPLKYAVRSAFCWPLYLKWFFNR